MAKKSKKRRRLKKRRASTRKRSKRIYRRTTFKKKSRIMRGGEIKDAEKPIPISNLTRILETNYYFYLGEVDLQERTVKFYLYTHRAKSILPIFRSRNMVNTYIEGTYSLDKNTINQEFMDLLAILVPKAYAIRDDIIKEIVSLCINAFEIEETDKKAYDKVAMCTNLTCDDCSNPDIIKKCSYTVEYNDKCMDYCFREQSL